MLVVVEPRQPRRLWARREPHPYPPSLPPMGTGPGEDTAAFPGSGKHATAHAQEARLGRRKCLCLAAGGVLSESIWCLDAGFKG